MKQKKLKGKLSFQKTTIATLDNQAKKAVKGGYVVTELNGNCDSWDPICPTKAVSACTCYSYYTCPPITSESCKPWACALER